MSTAEEIGVRVGQARREKAVRERRDITQREVAKAIGVSPTTVSDCESGKQAVGEAVLVKLANYLGVTPAYLRYGVSPTPSLDCLAKEPEGSVKDIVYPTTAAKRKSNGGKRA